MVLDFSLPGMNGLELIQRMSRESLSLPTLVISGTITESQRQQLIAEGAVAVFEKPALGSQLIDTISKVVGGT